MAFKRARPIFNLWLWVKRQNYITVTFSWASCSAS